ncbi:MAG: alpha/beta hydrolase [Chloroflexi bacterium]|nr:alpha/beta hydrolase [Chloroflexota bacterium]
MADPRLESAAAHWGPRFISNRPDATDVRTTLGRLTSWSDWCAEWSRLGAAHEQLAAEADARGGRLSAAEARVRAALAYHFGKFLFFDDREQARAAHDNNARCYSAAAPDLFWPAERVVVPSGSTQLAGWLRRPRGVERPPVVLVVPGLDSVKEEMGTLEAELLKRGLAILAIDGPGQGEAEWELPIEPAYERPAAAFLDWLESRSDVDGHRVGAVGISLGGYYVPRIAAFDERLRACVPVGGVYDMGAIWSELPALTRQALVVRSHAANDAEGEQRARRLTLEGVAERIRCPLLVVHGVLDTLIPWQHAARIHEEASGPKQFALYPDGNHVCSNIIYKWRPLVADWLVEQLGR